MAGSHITYMFGTDAFKKAWYLAGLFHFAKPRKNYGFSAYKA